MQPKTDIVKITCVVMFVVCASVLAMGQATFYHRVRVMQAVRVADEHTPEADTGVSKLGFCLRLPTTATADSVDSVMRRVRRLFPHAIAAASIRGGLGNSRYVAHELRRWNTSLVRSDAACLTEVAGSTEWVAVMDDRTLLLRNPLPIVPREEDSNLVGVVGYVTDDRFSCDRPILKTSRELIPAGSLVSSSWILDSDLMQDEFGWTDAKIMYNVWCRDQQRVYVDARMMRDVRGPERGVSSIPFIEMGQVAFVRVPF